MQSHTNKTKTQFFWERGLSPKPSLKKDLVSSLAFSSRFSLGFAIGYFLWASIGSSFGGSFRFGLGPVLPLITLRDTTLHSGSLEITDH